MTDPKGLGAAGRKLWDAVAGAFDFDEHDRAQIEEACHIRDTIATLREVVAAEGTMIGSSQGSRLHPGITEIRNQQLALSRILVTLRIPALEEDTLPASRGVRGFYGGGRG